MGVAMKERRFRASIYIDVWVPKTNNLENDREEAEIDIQRFLNSVLYEPTTCKMKDKLTGSKYCWHPYIGGVGYMEENGRLDRSI